MKIKDRIVELRRVKASELRPHPRNWRTHPLAQREALQGLLAEVGYAGALLARELEDGSLQLIDGHLRAETTPDAQVPVLVLDVSAEEAEKILATRDPLAAMAGADCEMLEAILHDVAVENEAVQTMLDELRANLTQPASLQAELDRQKPLEIPHCWQLVVECDDEAAQQALYERLTEDGYRCRVLTL